MHSIEQSKIRRENRMNKFELDKWDDGDLNNKYLRATTSSDQVKRKIICYQEEWKSSIVHVKKISM